MLTGDEFLIDDAQWQQYVDETTGLPYLYNTVTGESRWLEEKGEYTTSILNAWETYQDEEGNEFYYNTVVFTIAASSFNS